MNISHLACLHACPLHFKNNSPSAILLMYPLPCNLHLVCFTPKLACLFVLSFKPFITLHWYFYKETKYLKLTSKNFSCFTDKDECTDGSSDCHVNATCTNTLGSYICTCHKGLTGDGKNCRLIHGTNMIPDVYTASLSTACSKFLCVDIDPCVIFSWKLQL